jgi:Arc/MetJ-type ribon-helix-helix transcriptional regulator
MASTLEISLTEPFKTYVEAQTEAGDYGTPNQFIRELISDHRERKQAALEQRLLEALEGEDQAIILTAEEVRRGGIVALLEERLKARG